VAISRALSVPNLSQSQDRALSPSSLPSEKSEKAVAGGEAEGNGGGVGEKMQFPGASSGVSLPPGDTRMHT